MKRFAAVGLVGAVVVPAMLAFASPSVASVVGAPKITPNQTAPGSMVEVSAVFGLPNGWTIQNSPIQVQIQVPDIAGLAIAGLPPTLPNDVSQCALSNSDAKIACVWAPQFDSAQVKLVVKLNVGPSVSPQIIQVTQKSIVPGFDDESSSAPLLVTLTPTQTPNATPTPTVPATPTPTSSSGQGSGTGQLGGANVPTAVPAGEGPLDSSGSDVLPWGWVALLTGVGAAGAAATLKVRAQRSAASH